MKQKALLWQQKKQDSANGSLIHENNCKKSIENNKEKIEGFLINNEIIKKLNKKLIHRNQFKVAQNNLFLEFHEAHQNNETASYVRSNNDDAKMDIYNIKNKNNNLVDNNHDNYLDSFHSGEIMNKNHTVEAEESILNKQILIQNTQAQRRSDSNSNMNLLNKIKAGSFDKEEMVRETLTSQSNYFDYFNDHFQTEKNIQNTRSDLNKNIDIFERYNIQNNLNEERQNYKIINNANEIKNNDKKKMKNIYNKNRIISPHVILNHPKNNDNQKCENYVKAQASIVNNFSRKTSHISQSLKGKIGSRYFSYESKEKNINSPFNLEKNEKKERGNLYYYRLQNEEIKSKINNPHKSNNSNSAYKKDRNNRIIKSARDNNSLKLSNKIKYQVKQSLSNDIKIQELGQIHNKNNIQSHNILTNENFGGDNIKVNILKNCDQEFNYKNHIHTSIQHKNTNTIDTSNYDLKNKFFSSNNILPTSNMTKTSYKSISFKNVYTESLKINSNSPKRRRLYDLSEIKNSSNKKSSYISMYSNIFNSNKKKSYITKSPKRKNNENSVYNDNKVNKLNWNNTSTVESEQKSILEILDIPSISSKVMDRNDSDAEKIEKEINVVYNKIFDKYYRKLFDPKGPHSKDKLEQIRKYLKLRGKPSYLDDKIKDMKSKIFFIKGIFDFAYPEIIGHRLKIQKNLYEKEIKSLQRAENLKNQNFPSNLNVKTSEFYTTIGAIKPKTEKNFYSRIKTPISSETKVKTNTKNFLKNFISSSKLKLMHNNHEKISLYNLDRFFNIKKVNEQYDSISKHILKSEKF